MEQNFHEHWNNVYANKSPDQVSWTQAIPQTSLDFIKSFNIDKHSRIIDVGGGDSRLVDYLLDAGYENITVLDISEKALEKAKNRLGERASKVHWIVSDVTKFNTDETFDVWHDRAAFHFLTTPDQVSAYMNIARSCVKGFMTIGTFSTSGPSKCSGLEIKQYDEQLLTKELSNGFDKIRCITEDHVTPFNTIQNFLFCSFRRHEA